MNQRVTYKFENNIELFIKREDLIDPLISGNKYRKLKYNIEFARNKGYEYLITFGGAYSNHILATAAAGHKYLIKTVGVIRGQEVGQFVDSNPTLKKARELGMEFVFISRQAYKNKLTDQLKSSLLQRFENSFFLPEGGTNELAIKGCQEILTQEDRVFSHICVAVGTGGTMSGLINSSFENQKVIGYSALKGIDFNFILQQLAIKANWEVNYQYHFGGYAKISPMYIQFLNTFFEKFKIPLDPIYTGKMLYGIVNDIKQGKFAENSKILAIHTGGLQAIKGMNQKLKSKCQIVYG